MEIRRVILVIADISGYTRFIRFHKVSLIHAEQIITELLESVISSVDWPLILHELEGDAVTFYAIEAEGNSYASGVLEQVERCMEAFRKREAELISDCAICTCQACKRVGQLKIKTVLHRGEAAFTQLRQFTKVAGEDVILAHRLLKNDVPSNEYILMTEPFVQACPDSSLEGRSIEQSKEQVDGFGEVPIHVVRAEQDSPIAPATRSLVDKLKMFLTLEGYLIKRLFSGSTRAFSSLQDL
jgi:hypothetical protein